MKNLRFDDNKDERKENNRMKGHSSQRTARAFSALTMLLAMIVVTSSASSQVVMPSGQTTSIRQNVFGLGFFGGASGGLGLSFRHHLPSPLSYQITGGIVKFNDKLRSDIGVEVHYDLARSSGTRFFVAGGFAYYYSGKDGNEMKAPTRAGLGLGGEWVMSSGLHFLAEGMFTFFSDGTIFPLPQVGFYYYFN